ncbi:TIGR03792 family protein [Cyanobacterium stanieri LEGE 03274]|uniref:TIGR03792 family protein n=1 Tax=Cyanobacterium stanieri LEGE 03274 TaxID=1828756 RepID=A0ABR9V5X8_9CHRO|nr:TIGR03792 family protein [Cyanobacterium stanieri]MBE9223302.1 TIGR03792 family protein [Cyanobacterium stanieri LEGE 03274]
MVIEWLKFRVCPSHHGFFLEQDRLIWTRNLKNYQGFVDKQIWINPDCEDEIIFVITWASRDLWKAIPVESLKFIESKFKVAMGNISFEMIESREFYRV